MDWLFGEIKFLEIMNCKPPTLKLKVFIGFQYKSKFHALGDFECLGGAIAKRLRQSNPPVEISVELGLFRAGDLLLKEVFGKIANSDITIFDISENNPNVMLEAGISYGAQKHTILLRCNQSEAAIPSDIKDVIFVPYSSATEFVSSNLLNTIEDSINGYVHAKHDWRFYYKHLWSLDQHATTLIVPGILPKSVYKSNPFEDYMRLRQNTDLDAVCVTLESLARIYPDMHISLRSAFTLDELSEHWMNCNIVVIGGTGYNHIAKALEHLCPIEYKGEQNVWLKNKNTGKKYVPVFTGRGARAHVQDYGFFAKTSLAGMGSRKLVFLGGARTWGVLGTAKLVACEPPGRGKRGSEAHVKLLVQKLGSDPSFLVPVAVTGNKINGIVKQEFFLDQMEPLDRVNADGHT